MAKSPFGFEILVLGPLRVNIRDAGGIIPWDLRLPKLHLTQLSPAAGWPCLEMEVHNSALAHDERCSRGAKPAFE